MKKVIYAAALTLTLALGACGETEKFSPQEILNQAMEETSELSSYYAEYKMKVDNEGSFTAKEWQHNGKVRIEMLESTNEESITVNNGKTVTLYNKTLNSGSTYSVTDDAEGFVRPTLKEQAMQTLELVKDTHNITVGDSKKIAGRDTYHLIAKAKEKGSLIGDVEVWIDKKTWMTLKTVSITEDMKLTMEYTKFEPTAKIEDDLFKLDLPKDATIENLDTTISSAITAREAKNMLGDFLYVPESTGYELLTIEDMLVPETNEIALTYVKDGAPAFTLSIFSPTDAVQFAADSDVTVHGQPAEKTDEQFFKSIQWDEDGLRYCIMLEDEELTFDEVFALTEHMKVIQ